MRVLLIVMPARKSDMLVFPLGPCYVAADLEQNGHDVDVYDPNTSPRDYLEELREKLAAATYGVVGISLRNIDNNTFRDPCYYYLALAPTLATVRECLPGARIVIGGAGFSIFPELIMQRHREIDFGVVCEGVGVMSRLLDNLDCPRGLIGVYYREAGRLRISGTGKQSELDTYPDNPWRQLDLAPYLDGEYAVGILSKAGCAFNCAYCTYPHVSGRRVRARSPRLIVNDIERLVVQHGLRRFFFVDSVFNYPPQHALSVCEEITRRGIDVRWAAYFVEKYMDRTLMEAAVRAGCECFEFSPDGVNQAGMDALGKMNTEEDVRRSVELVKQCPGACASMGFMVNPPGQNLSGLFRLARFFAATRLRYPAKFRHVKAWYPRVYPNTALHARVSRDGDFPATQEELLPRTAAELKRTFWVNPQSRCANLAYDLVFLPKKLKSMFRRPETPHETRLFRARASGAGEGNRQTGDGHDEYR